ncbi:MAG: hypothetical protein NVSMB9_19250 [Isosphaeraceae bacterium]
MRRPVREFCTAFSLVLLAPITASAARPDPSIAVEQPDPASVTHYGSAYRYPRAGWIVLHVEGKPYERGYQHGRLLAAEITDYVKTLASKRSQNAPGDAWRETRTLVNALFLRRYDQEYLEEMKGIADGASAGGAAFQGRPLDLIDLVAVNSEIELDFLDSALAATETGLEARTFREPTDRSEPSSPPEHCSAFAANGPATADGKIVFGHITMFSLPFVSHFNVWLDIKPEQGHRVLMQTYPGGIQSGMDYYLNDAGLIVSETTIHQTKFDINGMALASRIRKALQYSDTIDKAVAILRTANNGMYTNEWLLADTKTNEIAMFELGTHKSKLWRSSKDEWFGGTKGFYWGCNNTKDLAVRLETVAGTEGRPANMVFHPADRDLTWLRLYEKNKGKIDTAFGFKAFTTPPLSAFSSCDAKFTTTEMARELKTWALFGPPLGRTWDPTDADRSRFAAVQPLISNDWTVLTAGSPETPRREVARRQPNSETEPSVRTRQVSRREVAREGASLEPRSNAVDAPGIKKANTEEVDETGPPSPIAWHGTILPKNDADTWLAAAFADYEKIVAREDALKEKARTAKRKLKRAEKDAISVDAFAPYSGYRTAVTRLGKDVPLSDTHASLTDASWYGIASGKGVLLLSALRDRLGDETFRKLMDDFGRAHAGQPVSTDDFRAAVQALPGQDLKEFLDSWLTHTGLPGHREGNFWSIDSYERELDRTLIVYGTLKESDAQREAADRLQRQIARKWSNITVPILPDRDATSDALKDRHVLLIGRPDTNSAVLKLASNLPVKFGPASFVLRDETYAHPLTALIVAGPRPDDPRREVVLYAGLSAEATWRCVQANAKRDGAPAEVLLHQAGREPRLMVIEGRPAPKDHDTRLGAH